MDEKKVTNDIKGKKKISNTYTNYLRETQHKMPDLPKNHSEPKNRKKHRTAVDHRIIWKNHEVRVVDVFYWGQYSSHLR